MLWRLLLAALVEIAYAILTRVWLPTLATGIELELFTTCFRAVSAVAYWLLFKNVILGRQPTQVASWHPFPVIAVSLLFLVPVLVGEYPLPSTGARVVFAITSIVVAIKEEILYRGALQNLIERRTGWLGAILLSNIAFTLYHYGAQDFTLQNVIGLYVVGCVLGLIYFGTGSIAIVIAIHAVDDAIWSFTPILSELWPRVWGTVLNILAMALCIAWAYQRSGKALNRVRTTEYAD